MSEISPNIYASKEYLRHINNLELLIYSSICFLTPFILGGPQLLVGSIVNMILYLSADARDIKRIMPVIILPSIGVISRGMIFGPFTHIIVVLIPFIWIGNYILVFTVQRLGSGYSGIFYSAVFKSVFLAGITLIFVNIGLIPSFFILGFGGLQFVTALTGGLAALNIRRLL